MYTCLMCRRELKTLGAHLKMKHQISGLEYLKMFFDFDAAELYESGKTTIGIVKLANLLSAGVRPCKGEVCLYLQKVNCSLRSHPERMKLQIEASGGVWNKGLTKFSHASVKRSSDAQSGENHPYNKLSPEEQVLWHEKRQLSPEQRKINGRKTSETLRKKYRDGVLVHISKTDPDWMERTLPARLAGYKRWLDNCQQISTRESKMERQISIFLTEENIRFQKHFLLNGFSEKGKAGHARWFLLDYYLPDFGLAVEFNGSYWHCDPRLYEANYTNSQLKKTAEEIWEKDSLKISTAKRRGIEVVVIWEYDLKYLNTEESKNYVIKAIKDQIDKQVES